MITTSTAVALLLMLPILGSQNQLSVPLPSSLSISVESERQAATLRHAAAKQTFEARAKHVIVSRLSDRIVVTMTDGDFTWTSSTEPVYTNSFQTLELKFEANGRWVSFRMY